MSIITITLIALGLAMDCFAVSVASGLEMGRLKFRHAFRLAFFFGFFQALMLLIGWAAGYTARSYISGVDHWVAFGLLAFIGGKMIWESFRLEEEEKHYAVMGLSTILFLSVATSIDSLAVGISLSLLKVALVISAIVIGAVSFILSFIGVCIGRYVGHFFESKVEIVGGLILIGLGIKILLEHTILR